MESPSNLTEVLNEALIKVDKAQELLDSLLVGGNLPFGDCSDLSWIHLDLPISHNNLQVIKC